MKSVPILWSILLLGTSIIWPATLGHARESAGGASRLRLDRRTDGQELLALDDATLQQLAHQLGSGHFLVQSAVIPAGVRPAGAARVFCIYPSAEAVQTLSPSQRIFHSGAQPGATIKTGSAEEMVRCFLAATNGGTDDATATASRLPALLSAALHGGRSRIWRSDQTTPSASLRDPLDSVPVDRREELIGLIREQTVSRDSAARLVWQGRYLRDDGGIEDVTVKIPTPPEERVILERSEVRPAGHFAVGSAAVVPVEEWVVVRDAGWNPPQRYKLMVTLAALGNAEKQFQLGTALLQESEPAAKAEGHRWLHLAAAQGHRDAVDLLDQGRDQLARSDRDRDRVRVSRCCPLAGR